ncbi:MAG TPA: dihydrofolate reductase family protein [Ktedonobacteraceae bacterium]|nr:dihydrofolate reductase family protein [Ktedonobacteraceae bacterium]
MGKIILDMSMSLDGCIAGLGDEDSGLHDYFFSPAGQSAQVVEEVITTTGAIIMGRRFYNLGDQLDGFVNAPFRVPHFVLTHISPEKPAKGETAFTFVTDGPESALTQAKAAAGDKNVVVGGGAQTAQQFLSAGLIEELHIHLVPVLLGEGLRLFEHLGNKPMKLEKTRVVNAPDAIHLTFRVVK